MYDLRYPLHWQGQVHVLPELAHRTLLSDIQRVKLRLGASIGIEPLG